jgi:hypothetical protein
MSKVGVKFALFFSGRAIFTFGQDPIQQRHGI